MVEPADAPPVFSRSDRSESEANVSVDGAEDAVTINKIGVTKEYNLMLGVNQPTNGAHFAQEKATILEKAHGEKAKEIEIV